MKTNFSLRSMLGATALFGAFLLNACAAPDAQTSSAGAVTSKSAEGSETTGTRFKVKDKDQINVQSGADVQSSGARGN